MLKLKCNSYFLCSLINSMMTAGTGRRQIHYGSSTRKPTRKAAAKLKQTRGNSPSTSAYVPDELKRRLEEWKQFLRKEEAVILYEKKKQIRDSGFDRIPLTFHNLTVDPLEGLLLDLSLHTLDAKLKRKYNEVFSQYTCVQLTPANNRYGKYVPYRNGIVIRNGGDSDILRVLIRGATDDRKLNNRELDIRELGTNSAWRLTIESIDTYCKVLLLLNREALLRQMPGFPLLQKTLKISGLDTVLTDRERKVQIDKSLNQSQRAAVMASLNPHRDFVAIHGPPGTGKTKVIAEIVLQFLQNNPKKHVIVCASSNKAVDNALIACVGRGLNQSRCMRVGNEREDTVDQVKDSYYQAMFRQHHFFESYRVVTLQRAQRELERTVERERLQKDPKSKQQALLETGLRRNITSQVLKDVRVVFSTVTSSALQKLLDAKLFKPDLIIMDEASQTMEPFGWKMLLQAKRFVIVGDHQQLQPILRSVRREQLDKPENRPGQSLIQRLMEEFEEKKGYLHLLNTNYRSNELILKWSNRHFYGGKVQTDEKAKSISLAKHIAEKRDKMTSKWGHKSSSSNNNSNGHAIVTAAADSVDGSPKNGKTKAAKTTTQVGRQRWIDDPLVLLDTANAREEVEKCKEKYPGLEPKHFLETNGEISYSYYNTGEAICAAHQLLALRLHGGLDFHEIGCITPYHQQIKEIRKRLGTNREFDRMDISTVDAFQGQQREAIVMSFVRSNRSNAIGFLSDLRRMNVAITRARRQFFLIASSDSLKSNAELRDLYNIICGEGRVIGITEFLLYNDIQLDFPQRRDRKKENERSEEYSKQWKSALLKVNW